MALQTRGFDVPDSARCPSRHVFRWSLDRCGQGCFSMREQALAGGTSMWTHTPDAVDIAAENKFSEAKTPAGPPTRPGSRAGVLSSYEFSYSS
jgi:hypothetical protein